VFWLIAYRGVMAAVPIYWSGNDLAFTSNVDRAVKFYDQASADRVLVGNHTLDGYSVKIEGGAHAAIQATATDMGAPGGDNPTGAEIDDHARK
jgi:hypothetical protein